VISQGRKRSSEVAKIPFAALLAAITIAICCCAVSPTAGHAETTRERILREGRIVVGIHNAAPWGYRDRDGEPAGWHPDLIKAAFSPLGITKIELRITEFGALIPGLMANRFDVVASGLAVTPQRCAQVTFGDPDLKVPDAALVLQGNPKNVHGYADIVARSDVIFGTGRGTATAANAAAAGVPRERTLLFPDIEANLAALRAGRIDVAAFSSPTAIGIMNGSNGSGLERASPFAGYGRGDNYAAIAFRAEDGDLRDLYNSRLKQMRADRTLAAIMERYGFGAPEAVPDGVTTEQLCGVRP
jgi:polar amino acid transport system substrate-binding protein